MRVTHVHRILGVGGSERHLLTLLPALRERGLDARFLGLDAGEPEPFYARLDALGVPYERLASPRDLDPLLLTRAARSLRRSRPDVVHTHLVHADVYGAAGSVASRSALVATKHNDDPFRRGSFRHVERLLTRRARRVICITESLRRFNVERVGLPAEKLEVVHYGMDEVPDAWAAGGPLPVSGDARVLLGILRLVPQKGVDVALEALARLLPAFPGAHLVVLGEGPERARLERQAAALGLAGAVSFPGRTGDVAVWLERAELLVHPARWEGFGLVLLEAMLAARPVVASAVSSIPEIVVPGETGLLVPADDPAALAAALGELLADPVRARALGVAGRVRAREQFSVARMADRTIEVYEHALAAR